MACGDKVPKGDPCARRSRSEDRQEVAQREEVRRVLEVDGGPVTAPAPLLRPLADPGPNRVQHDVADGFAEVLVALDRPPGVVVPEEVTGPPVLPIHPAERSEERRVGKE